MHPIFEEILRAKLPVRPDVLLRWQRAIRSEIGPQFAKLSEPIEVEFHVDSRKVAEAIMPALLSTESRKKREVSA